MSIRTGVARAVLVAVVVAVALALLAPATFVGALLAARTHGEWRIAGASGVWWRGAGTLAASNAALRLPVTWRVDLMALARGALAITLSNPDHRRIAAVEATRNRTTLRDLDLALPAATIASVAAAYARAAGLAAAGGTLALRSPQITWNRGRLAGSFEARWQRARIAFDSATLDLGDVTFATVPEASGTLRGNLVNRGGDVALSGALADDGRIISARLVLTPRVTAPEQVRAAIAAAGHPDAAGSVRLEWRTAW